MIRGRSLFTPVFSSRLAPFFSEYVDLKRALGRRFEMPSRTLQCLDRFLIDHSAQYSDLTAAAFAAWCLRYEHISSGVLRVRMLEVLSFCLYRSRTDSRCNVPDLRSFSAYHQRVKPHIFTDAEIAKLLCVASGLKRNPASPLRPEVIRLAIVLLYTTGIRRGELLELKLGDYDRREFTLHIRETKNLSVNRDRLSPASQSSRDIEQSLVAGLCLLEAETGQETQMKAGARNQLSAALSDYLTDHLPRLRGTSPHTIHSYRDSMVLLLRFLSQHLSKPVTELDLADLAPPAILAFLSYLEREHNNGEATRNLRLSAIHAFFRFVAARNPEHLDLAQRLLGIPFKRAAQRAIDYLEYDEIDAALNSIKMSTPQGSRDYALLSMMFNTGGRVREIADLRIRDLQLTRPFQVRLFGKGRKERYCPLWPQTAAVLRAFCQQRNLDLHSESHVFLNHRGQPLTRFGIHHILARCLGVAGGEAPNLKKKRLHPHSLRQSRLSVNLFYCVGG